MHGGFQTKWGLSNKRNSILMHHLVFLLGMGSMSWGGHLIHLSLPINRLLDSGIDPGLIPWMHDIIFLNRLLYVGFGNTPLVDLSRFVPRGLSIITTKLSNSGCIFLQLTSIHHLMIGIVLLSGGIILFFLQDRMRKLWIGIGGMASHGTLSLSLVSFGSLSLISSHHLVFMCSYPFFNI
jgi:photosystem I P700 chlorophyll a apoprotein A1